MRTQKKWYQIDKRNQITVRGNKKWTQIEKKPSGNICNNCGTNSENTHKNIRFSTNRIPKTRRVYLTIINVKIRKNKKGWKRFV